MFILYRNRSWGYVKLLMDLSTQVKVISDNLFVYEIKSEVAITQKVTNDEDVVSKSR